MSADLRPIAGIIARAVWPAGDNGRTPTDAPERAAEALADAGLLVEPGSDDRTGDEIAQAIFDVLDDAMVPAQPDENGDDYGQWISDLAPDLLAERIMAALTSDPPAAAPTSAADPPPTGATHHAVPEERGDGESPSLSPP